MFICILIVALIGVLGFGIYRDNQLQKTLAINAKINDAKMEAENKESERLDALKHKYKGKVWLAIGDSITYNNQYQSKVENLCKIATVITEAAPGQALGTMTNKLTAEKLSNIDLVTVFGGTNDYGGNVALGTINDDRTTSTTYGNIKNIIYKIQTLNKNIKIVFITPLKRGKYENQPIYPAPNGRGYKLEDYVQAIKDVCRDKSIQVIDLFNDSGIDLNNLSQYTSDNLHPNKAGYTLISKVIADELEKPAQK